ncbi:SIR2 family protein [Maribacter sp. PR1]|uniref:SIR2 family protein n=1 Tax=Maribacter cobaltidurans TaxID=1178778 RepID=A0ABU7IZF0_9FLAO|nr:MULTISPECIES: SIR2 family protein [Maribacter]MDC6390972.1 SIR2 family protein [Maribacter sp. PR1]MEE1978364.1 SIR2 family protein [Maribacter cobaltidurans]
MRYEDIRKVIESCHLNFLIGSGASKNFLETLKGVEVALDGLDKRTDLLGTQKDENVLKLIEVSIKYFYFKKCIEKNVDLLSITDDSNQTLNNYTNLLDSLNTILVKRSSNLVSKQVNLFTTNMDVFLDLALEKCGYSYNDGFSGRMNTKFGTENFHNIINKVSSYYEYQSAIPLFNLFKLHGSLNWKYNKKNDEIQYDNKLSTTKGLSKIQFTDKELIECFDGNGNFLKLSGIYKKAETKDLSKIQDRIDNFLKEYDNLIMVNPNKEKFGETTLKLSYYELLRMYSNNIEKENSVLFVIGFSFADEHIKTMTLRVAKSNPTLLIIIFAFDDKAEKEIRHNLGDTQYSNIIFLPRDNKNYSLNEVNKSIFGMVVKEFFVSPAKEEGPSEIDKDSNAK